MKRRTLLALAGLGFVLAGTPLAQASPEGLWIFRNDKLSVESLYAPDGAYTCTVTSGPSVRQVKGTWKADGDKLAVTMEGGKVSHLTCVLTGPVTMELTDPQGRATRMVRLVRLPGPKEGLGKPLDEGDEAMMTPLWWARQAHKGLGELGPADRVKLGQNIHMISALCGYCLASEGDLPAAGEILDTLPATGQPRALVLIGIAQALARSGQVGPALALAKELTGDERMGLVRAVVEAQLGVGDLAGAAKSVPGMDDVFTRAKAYLALAGRQLRLDQAQEARTTLQSAWRELEQTSQKERDLPWEQAKCKALGGDLEAAQKLLAGEKAEYRLAGYEHVAKAMKEAGRTLQALVLLEAGRKQTEEMTGNDQDIAKRWLASAYSAMGETDKALEVIQTIRGDGRKSAACAAAAEALAKKGRIAQASKLVETMSDDFPQYKIEALTAIAEAAGQAGLDQTARSAIKDAMVPMLDAARHMKDQDKVSEMHDLLVTRWVSARLPREALADMEKDAEPIDQASMAATICQGLRERLDEKMRQEAAQSGKPIALTPPPTPRPEPKPQPKPQPAPTHPPEIVSVWEAFGPELLAEFTADGKVVTRGFDDGKEIHREEGTWRVEAGKLVIQVGNSPASLNTWRITPADELELTDADGKANTMPRAGRKLWGVWETRSGEQVVLTEFTPDGKYVVRVGGGADARRIEGTYRLLGRSVEITVGGKASVRSWKVASKELELTDSNDRKAVLSKAKTPPVPGR